MTTQIASQQPQLQAHTPVFRKIAQDHYQVESYTHPGKWYSIKYVIAELSHKTIKRWICSCPDAQGPRHNGNCKHRQDFLAYLDSEIKRRQLEKAQRSQEHQAYLERVTRLHIQDAKKREQKAESDYQAFLASYRPCCYPAYLDEER